MVKNSLLINANINNKYRFCNCYLINTNVNLRPSLTKKEDTQTGRPPSSQGVYSDYFLMITTSVTSVTVAYFKKLTSVSANFLASGFLEIAIFKFATNADVLPS